MSLYTVYNLPPPPPPTAFSHRDPNGTRARFPDFLTAEDPGEACRAFMRQLMAFHMGKRTTVELVVGAGLIASLYPMAGCVLLMRLWQRSLWVFRLIDAPMGGRYVVVNSINAFILFAGAYGLLVIGTMVAQVLSFEIGTTWMWSIGIYYLYPWIPLFFAQSYSCSSLAFVQNGMSNISGGRPYGLTSPFILSRAWLWNTVTLVGPVLLVIPSLILGGVSTIYTNRALSAYILWIKNHQDSEALNQEMLSEAAEIWYQMLHGFYFVAIGKCVWALVGAVAIQHHHNVYWHVIKGLRSHLRIIEARDQPATRKRTMAPAPGDPIDSEVNLQLVSTEDEQAQQQQTFFPPVRLPAVTMAPARMLRRLLFYMTVMFVCIHIVAISLFVLAICSIALEYDALEHNWHHILNPRLFLAVFWISAVCGSSIIFNIFANDLEKVQSSAAFKRRASSGNPLAAASGSFGGKSVVTQVHISSEVIETISPICAPKKKQMQSAQPPECEIVIAPSGREASVGHRPFYELLSDGISLASDRAFDLELVRISRQDSYPHP